MEKIDQRNEKFKESLKNILDSETISVNFGINNALLGLGCSMKNGEDVMTHISLIKEVFVEKDIPPEKAKIYLKSFMMGLTMGTLNM